MAVVSFKCPNCDGELIFDPSTQNYKCEYCNSLFSQAELDAMKPASAGEQAQDFNVGTEEQAEEDNCRGSGLLHLSLIHI